MHILIVIQAIANLKAVLLFVFLGFAQNVSAQTQLNISQCFNELLQQKQDYSSTEQLKLATLAQISESTYEAFKRDGKLSAEYAFLAGSASYSDFSDKRRNYFSLHKLDLNYYRAISTTTRVLDPLAYDVINKCIQQLAKSSNGFHYLYTIDDAKSASIQFFWRTPINVKGTEFVKVKNSTLVNAMVVNGESYKGHLYDHSPTKGTPEIGIASPPILLTRTDPDTVIRIALETDPPVDVGIISIPPVPKPAKFSSSIENTNFVHTFFKRRDGGKPVAKGTPDCGDCDVYEKVIEIPGEVVSVTCTFARGASHINTQYCGPFEDNKVKWAYYTNDANEHNMTVTVTYKKKTSICIENCPP